MKNKDAQPYHRNVRNELMLVKKNKFPLFIIFSKKLRLDERIDLERYFADCNIYKTVDAEIDTSKTEEQIGVQVEKLLSAALSEKNNIELTGDVFDFQRNWKEDDIFVIVANKSYLKGIRGW